MSRIGRNNLFQFLSKVFGQKTKPACQGYRRAFLGGFQGFENLAYGCVMLHLGSWLPTFRWSILFPNSGRSFDTRLPDNVVSSTLKITDYPNFRMSPNEFHVPL
jgi:hypothetical protein